MGLDADTKNAIKGAVQSLVVTAGSALNVATGDIQKAADTISRKYGTAASREVEAEIARHLRNRG